MLDSKLKNTTTHISSTSVLSESQNYSFLFETPCEFESIDSLPVNLNASENSMDLGQQDNSPGNSALATLSGRPDDFKFNSGKNIELASGTIVDQISAGANSHIYKIWNADLEMFRAVKVCIGSETMHNAVNRFLTEAKIAAQLRHSNIIEVYSIGRWNQVPFIEMEFIDGFSVGQIIKQAGALPFSTSCAIAIFVCRALLYAHLQKFTLGGKTYQGVIHRDLKPVNIMISTKGTVKLLDFGIARPCDVSLYQTIASDKIVGTIQYLSPEQMDGSDLDFRTDIYSFGAVLYEMLSGLTTFPQTTLTSIVRAKVMNTFKSFSELNLQVPQSLQHAVEVCLEFKRENRYSSLQELLQVLEKIFHDEFSGTVEEEIDRFMNLYMSNSIS